MSNVKGLKELLKTLKIPISDIDKIVAANNSEMAQKARSKAPVDRGQIHQNIEPVKFGELHYGVVANAKHSGWVEFGTGTKVRVPPELAEDAAALKGLRGGTFEEGLRNIRDWCRRKGIDEEAAYPIFISILRKGIEPQPYMYPAFISQKNDFTKDMESYFKKRFK